MPMANVLPKEHDNISGAADGRFRRALTQEHIQPNHFRSLCMRAVKRAVRSSSSLRAARNCRGTGVPSHTIPGSFYSAQTGTYIFNALQGLAVQALSYASHFHPNSLSSVAAFDVSEATDTKGQSRCLIPTKRLPR